MTYLRYLSDIGIADVDHLYEKERTYQGSWKKRGGVGAYMMLARKIDRLESILSTAEPKYDIFAAIETDLSGADGSALAEVRDLRRYLLLVEAEIVARHKLPTQDDLFISGTPDDGGQHARFEEEVAAGTKTTADY